MTSSVAAEEAFLADADGEGAAPSVMVPRG